MTQTIPTSADSITSRQAEIVIVGAGAAGLMAGIHAGCAFPNKRILILDSAKKIGAKILIAGGGRCNVTHHAVDATAYAGSSRNAIKKVLRRFDVPQTVAFFHELGVELKREQTGKLFPTTDKARTVLDGLLRGVRGAGVEVMHPFRVAEVEEVGEGESQFRVVGSDGRVISAEKIILATGGKSIPKSGSDGHGLTIAQSLGHTLTKRIFPALVPLTLPRNHFICQLSGLTLPTTLTLRSGSGKKLVEFSNSTLCTHFGLSGPAVLDISRYWIDAKYDDAEAKLTINWLVDVTLEALEHQLINLGKRQPVTLLRDYLPDRLARTLVEQAGIIGSDMTREQRKRLVTLTTRYPLPLTGNRGYNYAEVTAGGVPLSQVNLKTMGSRVCPGLYLCGEICDVDGQIGGFNFQWAWASGYVAGISVGV